MLGLVGLAATALSADVFHAWYIDYRRIPRMVEAFERGSVGLERTEAYFARPALEKRLAASIAPKSSACFRLVYGEYGCGKSTLVHEVCRRLGGGTVLCVMQSDLFDSLRVALDYDVRTSGGFLTQLSSRIWGRKPSEKGWTNLLHDMRIASAAYRSKHKRQPSLVIDNISALVKLFPTQFDQLIGLAKDEASIRGLVMTLVANEDAHCRLLGMSASSRLGKVIEVGDLSDEEAQEYLKATVLSVEQDEKKEEITKDVVAKEAKKEELAKEIVAFAGGRMQLLVAAVEQLHAGRCPSFIKNQFLASAQDQLWQERIGLPKNPAELTERHVDSWQAIIRILDSPNHEERIESFTSSVGADLGEDLMSGNVFAFHPSRCTVGLQSRPMDIYLSQIVGSPDSTQRKALLETLKQFRSKL